MKIITRNSSVRFFCAAIGLFVVAAGALAEDAPQKIVEQANQRYDEGKFAEAKQLYSSLVERGQLSANLFYNLGDVEYRLGERGRAILNYERTLVLDPAHPEATADRAFVREQTGAKNVQPRAWERALPPWRADVFAIAAAAAGWTAIFAFALLFIQRGGRGPTVIGVFSLIAAVYFVAGATRLDQQRSLAIVTAKKTEARMAPAENSAILDTLPSGSGVRLLFERGPWSYCSLPDYRTGWIPSAAIERVQKTAS
ncbi:MAG: hypothetical protein M3O82_10455 [Verrucomicrobiota bacterium]|nr:hypothetical protein [Verrucomicrobiota bacterium]